VRQLAAAFAPASLLAARSRRDDVSRERVRAIKLPASKLAWRKAAASGGSPKSRNPAQAGRYCRTDSPGARAKDSTYCPFSTRFKDLLSHSLGFGMLAHFVLDRGIDYMYTGWPRWKVARFAREFEVIHTKSFPQTILWIINQLIDLTLPQPEIQVIENKYVNGIAGRSTAPGGKLFFEGKSNYVVENNGCEMPARAMRNYIYENKVLN
jgi:hypothetical protein